MPWISEKKLSDIYTLLERQGNSICEMSKQLNNQQAVIEDLRFSSTARTYSMGEVDLAKLAIKVEEINRKIESGQLAKDAADRLVKDILTAYYKGMQ